MCKYLIFAGTQFYPLGGVADFYKEVKSIQEAKKEMNKDKEQFQWAQIIKIENSVIKCIYCGNYTFGMSEWQWIKYKNTKEMQEREY